MRAWFAPKRPGFHERRARLPADPEARLQGYEAEILPLDDVVEWRAFDAAGRAALFDGVDVRRLGGNRFAVGEKTVDLNFAEDQAPHLISLPPSAAPVLPDVFEILCLGSDSGFELEHPTTGFAVCLNGSWAVVDAPVCASYLLAQYGIDLADVRAVVETHGHEDHMGSAIHFLLEFLTAGRSYTYLAAEPVYRTCAAKVAAILGVSEPEADRMLSRGRRDTSAEPSGGVVRVTPGVPVRLLGATWRFAWTVHPIPTTGFRIELEHDGRARAIAYSSDTAPRGGPLGTDAMAREGFLDPDVDPFRALVRGNEDLVFWEAGGTNGDPIHYDAREWEALCAERGVRPPTVLMHTHPMPPGLRRHAVARPGMTWSIARGAPVPPAHVARLADALRFFELRDPGYWLRLFLGQGAIRTFAPGSTIVAEGDPGDAWYIILHGRVDVLVGSQAIETLGSGAFFGELALLDHARRKATVRASSPSVVLRVPPAVFREFVVANDLWAFFRRFWQDVGLLQQARLFFGFPHEVAAQLARRAERRRHEPGAVLIREGEAGDEVYVLVEGAVAIERGGRPVAELREPGEVFGEYGVLVPGARRTATVRAASAVEVLVLTGDILDEVVAGQIPLQLRLVAMLRERGLAR
jgi:CRP-like cAMP-binding protein